MTPAYTLSSAKPVAFWLLVCCALIFAMVVLGGVTRLTRSGLSIVEWDPIMGAVPPLTQTRWEQTFDKYKQTPEYTKVNSGMSIEEFKGIFYVEWAHRLLGRLIGAVFLIPFLYFLVRRRITRELAPKLIVMFVLGGLQGALGWYMVKSGLVDIPRVSPYRLTAHLAFAVIIYAYMFWTALGLLYPPEPRPTPRGLGRFGVAVTALIFLMILSGGFVAGNKAGFAFNTFPWMNGRFIPEGLYALQPLWSNPFENIATVQFNHRLLAYLLCLVIPVFWWRAMRVALPARARLAVHFLTGWLAVQVLLGIATLLYVVPIPLAAAHQAGALVLFSVALTLQHSLRTPR
ncbi:COX15/CtaA family protein [Sulfuricaulis sp.]|jgi:cytochrome c oxidase assembly protein subunit 15|uniref:COX15/CtaA family protein n=1 Tax=Sulfuricaulis sp. TaxID=2003553 RepID=UPI003559CC0E